MIARILTGSILFAGLAIAADTGRIRNDIAADSHVGDEAWYELYIREPVAEPEKHPDVGWMFYSKTDTAEDVVRRAGDAVKLEWQTKVEGPKYAPLKPGPGRIVIERIAEDKKNRVYRDKLYFNGNYLGQLIENRDTMIPPSAAGKAYPAIVRTTSGKNFVQSEKGKLSTSGDFLMEVGELPDGWTDILLHPGTKREQSRGCFLGGAPTATEDPKSKEKTSYVPETLKKLRIFYFMGDKPQANYFRPTTIAVRGHPNALDMDELQKQLTAHEGNRPTVYLDSMKIPTIGIGFNLNRSDAKLKIEELGLDYRKVLDGKTSLSNAQIRKLFAGDVENAIMSVRARFADFDKFPEMRKRVVVDMMFNLGAQKFDGFKKMIAALKERDFDRAAAEMKDSTWFGQVGHRATTLYDMMKGDRDFGE